VSEPSTNPVPYKVAYSERVRDALRSLIIRARHRGLAQRVLTAVKELDYRFHVYPQFGQPLRDLKLGTAQIWIGVAPPLVARYFLDEERRLVVMLDPPLPLPGSGLQT